MYRYLTVQQATAKGLLLDYGMTISFCMAIAVLLWAIGLTSFIDAVVVSLSIGLCINTTSLLGRHAVSKVVPAPYTQIPLQVLGLFLGLVVSAWIISGSPWFFLQESQATVFLGIFFGTLAYILFTTMSRLTESKTQLAEALRQQEAQERQLAQTQLKLLQAQIEPHFLFNTLSNATSLIRTDPDAAEHTLENLTVLFRQSLKRTRAANTTLGEEADLLNAYLNIQKIRMGERLSFSIDIPNTLRQQPLPPLLLQPLVENAVTHGIEPKADGGNVDVYATMEGNTLQLTVSDTGLGIHAHSSKHPATSGNGTALTNIRARLSALYGDLATLSLRDNDPSGLIAELRMPLASDPG